MFCWIFWIVWAICCDLKFSAQFSHHAWRKIRKIHQEIIHLFSGILHPQPMYPWFSGWGLGNRFVILHVSCLCFPPFRVSPKCLILASCKLSGCQESRLWISCFSRIQAPLRRRSHPPVISIWTPTEEHWCDFGKGLPSFSSKSSIKQMNDERKLRPAESLEQVYVKVKPCRPPRLFWYSQGSLLVQNLGTLKKPEDFLKMH